jgi:hypothetical protein
MSARRRTAWVAAALLAGATGCDEGCGGTDGGFDVRSDVPSQRFCGDGACVVAEGENTRTCPADCGPPRGSGAEVRFFADFAPKAAEYGRPLRFTYVVWNQGSAPARNVVLPVPIVQDETTTIYGEREHCGSPGERYDCMVDVSYVPGSMRINRVYHPNRARNSYAFVDTLPLSDALDDDEAWFDAERNLLFLALPELRARDDDPEDAGVLWSFELLADESVSGTPCEELPLVQNWNWILADNSPEYMNDIIGHLVCASPHLRAAVEPDRTTAAPGDTVVWSVTLSQDFIALPPGREDQRFTLLRPRLYLDYPEAALEVVALDLPEEAEDLVGFDDEPAAGGVVYWARTDDAGEGQLAPGESEMLHVTTRVREGVPAGTELRVSARVTSQRTSEYQEERAEATVAVSGAVAAACGDGFCSAPGETAASCAADCPGCSAADTMTGFADPPCCDGLTRVRAAQPYGWAYEQCYDWEGGGVSWVQGCCVACGDGRCSGLENACNCPDDCGPHCGNWRCEAGEERATCPADC